MKLLHNYEPMSFWHAIQCTFKNIKNYVSNIIFQTGSRQTYKNGQCSVISCWPFWCSNLHSRNGLGHWNKSWRCSKVVTGDACVLWLKTLSTSSPLPRMGVTKVVIYSLFIILQLAVRNFRTNTNLGLVLIDAICFQLSW